MLALVQSADFFDCSAFSSCSDDKKIKTKPIKLFENLDNRKKVSVDIYEKLHKRKISSNINNNDGIIKLSKISKDEFTEGLRNYIKY